MLKRPRRLSPEDVALEYLGKDDPEGFQLLFIDSFIGRQIDHYINLNSVSRCEKL